MTGAHAELARLTEDWDTPATRVQREAAALRYGIARDLAGGGTLLDVACGTGFGVDHVASATGAVAVGGDLSFDNLRTASQRSLRGEWVQLSAEALPFRDTVADLVTCFEAIYYLDSIPGFLAEARRVLRPGGRLLVTFPNRERPGFSPSPGSRLYPGVRDFRTMCAQTGFSAEVYGAFSWKADTISDRALDLVRRALGRLNLMPKSMAMRGLLKKLAYRNVGPLTPLPTLEAPMEQLSLIDEPLPQGDARGGFLVTYGLATKK